MIEMTCDICKTKKEIKTYPISSQARPPADMEFLEVNEVNHTVCRRCKGEFDARIQRLQAILNTRGEKAVLKALTAEKKREKNDPFDQPEPDAGQEELNIMRVLDGSKEPKIPLKNTERPDEGKMWKPQQLDPDFGVEEDEDEILF